MTNLLLILFVFVAVLMPGLRLADGLPYLRPEVIVAGTALMLKTTKFEIHGHVPRRLGLFGVVALVAITGSYTILDIEFNPSDLSIFLMLIQYWLVYCFWVSCVRQGFRSLILWSLSLAVCISAAVGIAQKFNLFSVNDWLTTLYVIPGDFNGELSLRLLTDGHPAGRAIGTVGDPRHCAMLYGFGTSAAMALMLSQRDKNWKWILLLLLIGIQIFGVLVTYSRTGALACALSSCLAIWLGGRRGGHYLVPVLLVFAALAAVAAVVSFFDVVEKDSRLTMDASDMMETSGYARVRDNLEPFQKSIENPLILIIGMGPAKAVLPGSEHGETGWLILRYGLCGFFIYLSMIKWAWLRGSRIHRSGSPEDAAVASFVLQGIVVWMVFFLAESIFKLGQIMSINMLLLAVPAGIRIPQRSSRRAGKVAARENSPSGIETCKKNTGTESAETTQKDVADPLLELR